MSLRAKFALLLGLLGLAVAGNLAAALWSFDLLNQQVSRPFAETATVLRSLGRIKLTVEAQSALVRGAERLRPEDEQPGPADDQVRHHYEQLSSQIRSELVLLSRNESYVARVGKSTSRNLESRLQAAVALSAAWFSEPSEPVRGRLTEALFQLHELIEMVEMQILEATDLGLAHDEGIRTGLTVVMLLTLPGVVLIAVLGFNFFRRWVIVPVGNLRTAAARIGAGDFDHRIPVQGSDELAQLSSEVNHMAAMVRTMQDERVERERLAAVGEMVRRLAHNLRNPLAGIRGLAELSRSESAPGSDMRENQDRIIAAVDRFEGWLKELLGATTPLAVQPSPVDIRPWLAGVVETHRPAADLKGVVIELAAEGAPQTALVDPRHLEQALVALLANAIDASPPGGRIRVAAATGQNGDGPAAGGVWEILVQDEGPGVPPEIRERIFKPYFTTKRDGNGIGLAVAKQVVVAHGGTLEVESGKTASGAGSRGPGATFRVRLPLQPARRSDGTGSEEPLGVSGGQNSRHRR